jgi:glycogen debranching enzyme
MGHLLWSGIVPRERAQAVVAHLLSPPMFSGWGVRTLSTEEAGYDPVGYHLGTVWPHDNALIASGLARYGFRDEAATVAGAILDAAARFDAARLPETFTGFDRDDTLVPVWYPKAASPQAWSAATPLHLVRVLLGLDARHGILERHPAVPQRLAPLRVTGVRAGGTVHTVTGTPPPAAL